MRGKVFARLLRELKGSAAYLISGVLSSLVSVALSLYIPVVIGETIDAISSGTEGEHFREFVLRLAVIGCLAASSAVFRWISDTLFNIVSVGAVGTLRQKAYYKLSLLPASFFDSRPKGDVISRIMSDTDTVGNGLLLGMSQLFGGVVTIVGTLVLMLRISPKITLAVVVLTPLSLGVASLIAKSTYKYFLDQSKKKARETSLLSESLGNLKLQKAFVREDAAAKSFDIVTDSLASSARRAIFASSLVNPATRFVGAVIYAAIGLIGAFTAIGGALTVGELTCFLSYASQYTKPFNEISAVVAEIQGAVASASRVFELLDEKEEEDGGDNIATNVAGRVSFKDVSFSYDKERPLLKHLSFDIEAGQRVAIVGPTGCGKTTLINLLMRFYDPDSGVIELDGVDTKTIPRKSLRDFFGMVLQDTFLFDATVEENIKAGAPDATRDEVVAAAKATHADRFIKKLPEGYDTVLTEGGSALSEGERQLLSITRVMLSSPTVLILDEATSSVDTRTEAKINDAFEKLMSGRTSFIVAHRITTVKGADVILVMKDGDVVERGKHDELMAKGGFYKTLYESQFGN